VLLFLLKTRRILASFNTRTLILAKQGDFKMKVAAPSPPSLGETMIIQDGEGLRQRSYCPVPLTHPGCGVAFVSIFRQSDSGWKAMLPRLL
jgi:hypothetical protein